MSIGDILNPKRIRTQANERLDTVDADALSLEAREHLDAYARAVEATPRNAGASVPTGLIFQGFGLTLNPTGPSDNKVRVQSPTGVAFDANGRLIVKENGVQVDLTLSSGNSQIYVYYVESASDTAVRRVISVTAPYVESPANILTKLKGDAAFYIRAGDQTSIVASDVVNGATTALCFLGVANNAAGAVTMTGYDSVNAPNGAFATNRITAVAQPTTIPPGSAGSGSVATMHGLVNAALYMLGQLAWKGSRNFTPAAANNFGAFSTPTAGVDGLFNALAESTTSPITRWRDWQGNNRALVDHSGYRMGQVTEIDQNWSTTSTRTVSCSAASFVSSTASVVASIANGSIAFINAGSAMFSLPGILGGYTVVSISGEFLQKAGGSSYSISVADTDVGSGSATVSVAATGSFTTNGTPLSVAVPAFSGALPWNVAPGHVLSTQVTDFTSAVVSDIFAGVTAVCIVDPEGWVFTSTNNGGSGCKRSYTDPDSSINHRSPKMTGQGTGAQTGSLNPEAFECFMNADVAFTMEWILRTGTITDANNTRLFAVGIQNSNALANNRFVYLFNQNTTANWQLRVVGSATADTDTGVAIAANTVYRMRLEVLGANVSTAGANNFRIRAFINGAKVADIISSTLPVADMIRPIIISGTTGTGGPYDFRVGRVRRAWNHLLNGDNL